MVTKQKNNPTYTKRDGKTIELDSTDQALAKFKLKNGDEFKTPKGKATVIGVCSQGMLWFQLECDQGKISYWNVVKEYNDLEKQGIKPVILSVLRRLDANQDKLVLHDMMSGGRQDEVKTGLGEKYWKTIHSEKYRNSAGYTLFEGLVIANQKEAEKVRTQLENNEIPILENNATALYRLGECFFNRLAVKKLESINFDEIKAVLIFYEKALVSAIRDKNAKLQKDIMRRINDIKSKANSFIDKHPEEVEIFIKKIDLIVSEEEAKQIIASVKQYQRKYNNAKSANEKNDAILGLIQFVKNNPNQLCPLRALATMLFISNSHELAKKYCAELEGSRQDCYGSFLLKIIEINELERDLNLKKQTKTDVQQLFLVNDKLILCRKEALMAAIKAVLQPDNLFSVNAKKFIEDICDHENKRKDLDNEIKYIARLYSAVINNRKFLWEEAKQNLQNLKPEVFRETVMLIESLLILEKTTSNFKDSTVKEQAINEANELLKNQAAVIPSAPLLEEDLSDVLVVPPPPYYGTYHNIVGSNDEIKVFAQADSLVVPPPQYYDTYHNIVELNSGTTVKIFPQSYFFKPRSINQQNNLFNETVKQQPKSSDTGFFAKAKITAKAFCEFIKNLPVAKGKLESSDLKKSEQFIKA